MLDTEEIWNNKKTAMNDFFQFFLKSNDSFSYSIFIPDNDIDKLFDCRVEQNDLKKDIISKRLFFKCEILDSHSPLFLEKKSFDDLKELVWDNNDKIYYITFTPKGTLVYDLLKIEGENKILFFGKEEAFSDDETEMSAHIDITDAKFFDYLFISKEKRLEIEQKELEKKKEEVDKNQKEIEFDEFKPVEIIRDSEGNVVFTTMRDFLRYPLDIQWEYVNQFRIKNWLLPTENKDELLKEHGSVNALGKMIFVRERIAIVEKIKLNVVKRNARLRKQYGL